MRLTGICLLSALLAFFVGRAALETLQERRASVWRSVRTGPGDAAPPSAADHKERTAPPRDRLIAALSGDDPLAAAAKAQAWIDAATPEDFQALVVEGVELILPRFEGFDQEFRRLFFEALFRRWFEIDSDGALAALLKIQARTGEYIVSDWLEGAARTQPEIILANLPIARPEGGLLRYAATAFRVLANRNSAEARRFLTRAESAQDRSGAQAEIVRGVAQSDPVAAVAMARELKLEFLYSFALNCAERIGAGAVREVIATIPNKSHVISSLPRLMLRYPAIAADLNGDNSLTPYDLDEDTRSAADAMSPEQRQRTLSDYDSAPPAFRDTLAAAAVSAWARTDPAEAGAWAIAHADLADPNAPANQAAREVMQRWMKTNPDAALIWWRSLADSPLGDALGMSATAFFAEQGRVADAIELFRPGNLNRDDWRATAHLAGILAETDPLAAAEWFSSIPEEVDAGPAARALMTSWISRDPVAARRWLKLAPPGMHRDEAARVSIELEAETDAVKASDSVLAIEDQQLRRQAALWVYWKLQANGTEVAERWLRGVPGLDENWRERILRTRRGTYTYVTAPDR